MRITSEKQIETARNTSDSNDKKIIGGRTIEGTYLAEQQLQLNDQPSMEVVKKAVAEVNEFLEIHNQKPKFVFHEELEQYYVQVVDAETEEVIKEIPPKKLLDGYYAMQKFIGIFYDEKI